MNCAGGTILFVVYDLDIVWMYINNFGFQNAKFFTLKIHRGSSQLHDTVTTLLHHATNMATRT